MKLLLDHNLSPRLAAALDDRFPGTRHAVEVGLSRASDQEVWDFPKREGYVIVSKDADFHQRSFLYGHPPKVVWIRLGNCSSADVLRLLLGRLQELTAFVASESSSFLVLV